MLLAEMNPLDCSGGIVSHMGTAAVPRCLHMLNSTISRVRLTGLLIASAVAAGAADPQVVLLWPKGAPGSEGKTGEETVRVAAPGGDHVVAGVHSPSITAYLPSKETASGAAVVIA